MIISQLTPADFISIFSIPNVFYGDIQELMGKENLSLSFLSLNEEEKKKTLEDIEKNIDSAVFGVVGQNYKENWEKRWGEKLEEFEKSDCDLNALVPKYIRSHPAARLYGDYVKPLDAKSFELSWKKVFAPLLFKWYFSGLDTVYEFGCGTCMYLAILAQIFPKKEFYGLDWISSAAKFPDLLGKKYGWNMNGGVFDMFNPDKNFKIKPNSGVLLFSALEQLGTNFGQFLDFLIAQKPSIVVVVDSFYELYNESFDSGRLARKFMESRNYLRGFLPKIIELAKKGKIEILKINYSPIGNLYIDGQSYVVFKPL